MPHFLGSHAISGIGRCQVSAPPTVQEVDAEMTPPVAKQGRIQETNEGSPEVARAVTCAVVGFDRLFREMLGSLLHLRVGLRLVAQAENGTDGREACLAARPDLVILDFAGQGRSVLAIAEQLLTSHADSRAIVITAPHRVRSRSFRLPADRHAVVSREESVEQLLARLESLFADRLAEAAGRKGYGAEQRYRPLTDRETQIMKLLGEGLTTREIATILNRSPHTIQTHRKRIAEKVGRLGSRISRRMASDRHARGDGAPGRG
jgi:DNA-binding NarL/FixJ family response regulator